jgi:hypothetical protein
VLKELANCRVCFLWIPWMYELSDSQSNACVDNNLVECKRRVICCVGASCLRTPSYMNTGRQIPRRQYRYNVTLRRVRATLVAVKELWVLHNLRVCLLPQVSSTQCAWAIWSSVACPALQNFITLFHKWHDFRKKKYWIYNVCVSSFSTTFFRNILSSK